MSETDGLKQCPYCSETIRSDAILCRFCQRGLSSEHFKKCTACGEMIRNEAILCRYCKTRTSKLPEKFGKVSADLPRQMNTFERLQTTGLLTPEDWERVQLERQETGESVLSILNRLGLATENHIKNALELQYGVNCRRRSKNAQIWRSLRVAQD